MSCWIFFFFKQKTAYEMLSGDWSSDVCSSDLRFGTEAGSPGGDVNGQSLFRNGFVAIQVVQFDFGCGGEPKVCAFQAEKIGGKFGQLAGTGERGAINNERR